MIVQGFYNLIALLDYLVFKLVSTMISINLDIAGKEIFTSSQIQSIANRIYIVVGVLMLFKLVISAIQYMVNPDAFDDKEKGLGGLLKKTVISIALMVLAPAVFDFMMIMQNSVIETIPKVIFGKDAGTYSINTENTNNTSKTTQEISDNMSFTILSAFIEPRKSTDKNEIKDIETFRTHAADGCGGGIIGSADNCKYNYMIIISTISGGFLCYVLMTMTMDVAIRTIKFSIIRILAPIPISSYVFSKDKLNKFVKTALSVYFDLFIRLAVICFIIFTVKNIMESNLLGNIAGEGWFRNAIVNIAIIGGLFAFAKTAPKFISELLGIPDIGAGDMKDMFKPVWQRNGALGALGGMAGAGLANMANKISQNTGGDPNASFWQRTKNTMKDGKLRRQMWKSGIGGATSAGFHGGLAAMQGKDAKEVNKAGYKRAIQARTNREIAKMKGVTGIGGMVERAKIKAQDYAGIVTPVSLMASQQKAMSNVASAEKAEIGRTNDILSRNAAVIDANHGHISTGLHTMMQNYMKELGATTRQVTVNGQTRLVVDHVNNAGAKDLIESVINGDRVSLSNVLSFADYTGEDTELKQLSQLLDKSGDYRSNLHKNATQQAYNGGVYSMDVDAAGNQLKFEKLDSSSDKFDVQLAGFHNSLVQTFINDADSFSILEGKIKDVSRGRLVRRNGETVAQFLDRAYKAETRNFETAIDEANTEISAATQGPKASRESVIREDIKRRSENKDKK